MFPLIESRDTEGILSSLENHMGVFIKDAELAQLGKETFLAAKEIFASGQKLPPLDEKTMFPNTIATLPGVSRKVIQRFTYRPFDGFERPFKKVTSYLSSFAAKHVDDILFAARERYQWDAKTFDDVWDDAEWALNIANYSFVEGHQDQLLFPAHKDWGMLAIYPYIDGPGLEVYVDDQYRPLILPENCLLCYAGDIFTRITGGKVKALLHRVKQPDVQVGDRTSVIFYADPIRSMKLPDGTTVGDIIDSKLRKIGQIK